MRFIGYLCLCAAILALAACSGASALPTPSDTPARPSQLGEAGRRHRHHTVTWYTISDSEDNLCLGGTLQTANENGSFVQKYRCNGRTIQQWAFVDGPAGSYVIVNREDGKCLDGLLQWNGINGSPVQLWDCNGREVQEWIITPFSTTNVNSFKNHLWNKCLDSVSQQSGVSGVLVQLWDCKNYYFEPVAQQAWWIRFAATTSS